MTDGAGQRTILFAGGGTGGHLFPSLAIAEHLPPDVPTHFACSTRPIDSSILSACSVNFTPISVHPWPPNPFHWPSFLLAYFRAVRESHHLLTNLNARLVIAMGGFVCAPVVAAANRLHIPVILVNLDAVPGKANRRLARHAQQVFSVYPNTNLAGAGPVTPVGFPVRRAAIADIDPQSARRQLNLDPTLPTLLITGASQGAQTINNMMIQLAARSSLLPGVQLLHLAGSGNVDPVQSAYQHANLRAIVLPFSDRMGLAWAAADLAISRAGAGSAAEAALNSIPTIFMPYPYHNDQHQRHNAQPLASSGGAIIIKDLIDPTLNASQLSPILSDLLANPARLQKMRHSLQQSRPSNGASDLASAAMHILNQ